MRGRVKRLLILASCAFCAFCPTLARAQGARGGRGGAGIGRAGGGSAGRGTAQVMDEHTVVALFSALLNLSNSQRQQVQAAFDAAAQTAGPVAAQLQAGNDALFAAIKTGQSDGEIRNLATQQGALRSQLLVLQAETFSKACNILNSDQRNQVNSFLYDDIGDFLSDPAAAPESSPPSTTP